MWWYYHYDDFYAHYVSAYVVLNFTATNGADLQQQEKKNIRYDDYAEVKDTETLFQYSVRISRMYASTYVMKYVFRHPTLMAEGV